MQSRWQEHELQVIKDVFKDNEFVLAVRDVFYGLTDEFTPKTTDTVIGILRKNLLPTFQSGVPLLMQQDLALKSLEHINGFNAEQGVLRIEAYDLAEDYLERRFKVLQGEIDNGETLKDFKTKGATREDRFVRMLVYLQVTNYIEKSLAELVTIANTKELTNEEILAKAKQNSSK